ncbi:hypothetical protein MMC26_002691 [Xylographa opegraphella]|nr:hypothetical protein [Xylographa opegraphella]
MASSFSLELAPELLIYIFRSFDSLRDVSHLAATSRVFREIFLTNANSIYSAVGPRHTPLFNEAQALLDAQDDKAISQGEPAPSTANEAAAIRMIRLGLNERILSRFVRFFANDCFWFAPMVNTRQPPSVTGPEVIRFKHAYYGLWTLMERMPLTLNALLATTSAREFVRLSDVLVWVCARFDNHDTKYQPFAYKKWETLQNLFQASVECGNVYFYDMPDSYHEEPRLPSWMPWSVWDEFQEQYVDMIPDMV